MIIDWYSSHDPGSYDWNYPKYTYYFISARYAIGTQSNITQANVWMLRALNASAANATGKISVSLVIYGVKWWFIFSPIHIHHIQVPQHSTINPCGSISESTYLLK